MCALSVVPGLLAGYADRPRSLDLAELDRCGTTCSGYVAETGGSPSIQRLMVEVDSVDGVVSAGFKVLLQVADPQAVISPGDIVRFKAFLLPPTGENIGCPYDGYDRVLFQRRVSAVAELAGTSAIEVCGHRQTWGTRLAAWRARVADVLVYSGLEAGTADFLIALLLGDRQFLDYGMRQDFARVGIAHVLALSGTHLAVVALMISWVFFPLRVLGRRRWQWVVTMALLWGYACLTGLSPSVVRAVVMATFLLVARTRRWQSSPLNALCGAALLILAVRPFDLFAVGFQLSFAAVASLIMFARMLTIDTSRRWLRMVSQWVGVSVAAVGGTAPLAAWYFHTFPVAFLFSNLFAAALVPVLMVCGMAVLLLSVAGVPCAGVAWCADTASRLLARGAAGLSSLPGCAVEVGDFSAWWVVAVYAGVVMLWFGLRARHRVFSAVAMVVIAASLAGIAGSRPRRFENHMFPLGSRTAVGAVVRTGDAVVVFTDAVAPGLRRQIGREALSALERRGIMRGSVSVEFAYPGFEADGLVCDSSHWHIYGHDYVIAGRDVPESSCAECDYVVVTRGFRGSVAALADSCRPRVVILSPTLYPARALAYADTLRNCGHQVAFRY